MWIPAARVSLCRILNTVSPSVKVTVLVDIIIPLEGTYGAFPALSLSLSAAVSQRIDIVTVFVLCVVVVVVDDEVEAEVVVAVELDVDAFVEAVNVNLVAVVTAAVDGTVVREVAACCAGAVLGAIGRVVVMRPALVPVAAPLTSVLVVPKACVMPPVCGSTVSSPAANASSSA